ncbi:protease PrsW [Tersicoccus solisilvae]|uniref:Protease PrsW n=1 Tax=Tersicoccus solisilvae TaxID=1882339 RepID=A0ABQ1NQC0_9MICC|nr:PrsW family intramembrane metalloprotease [Tersicoccus solisilvae]GGC82674.1 protease PrsW [Tersicoccus solisilvae]
MTTPGRRQDRTFDPYDQPAYRADSPAPSGASAAGSSGLAGPAGPGWTAPGWRSPTRPHASPAPERQVAVAPLWQAPARRRRGVAGTVVLVLLFVFLAAASVGVGLLLVSRLGATAFLICWVLALVPLSIVLLAVRWLDRWEPEPLVTKAFAFLWGAAGSIVVTMTIGEPVRRYLQAATDPSTSEVLGTVLQAPVVEEFAKGLGVLLLVLLRRRHVDGPVDGVVYAMLVAAGFAFTENILYFGSTLAQAGVIDGSLAAIFIGRGLLSPFAHTMFTACLGFALGWASRRHRTAPVLLAFVLGLLPAVALHALWNGGATLAGSFLGFYVLIEVPLFVLGIVGVVLLGRGEVRLTRARLADYVHAGWFTPAEVQMLATPAGRRQALAWAGTRGARAPMKRFVRDATALAFTRQRIIAGFDRDTQQEEELRLLHAVTTARGEVLARVR